MYIVYLLFMGLFVAWLAVPMMRGLNLRYGRYGRTGDAALVMGGTLIAGVAVTALFAAFGASINRDVGALMFGAIGAFFVIIMLTLFSAITAAKEEADTREHQTEHGSPLPTEMSAPALDAYEKPEVQDIRK